MTRDLATKFCRSELDKHGLSEWHIRLVNHMSYLGLCDYKTKTIFLCTYHIDIHPESEVYDTIKHEIAHALYFTNTQYYHEMDELVEKLEETDMSNPSWLATAKQLSEKVHHHLKSLQLRKLSLRLITQHSPPLMPISYLTSFMTP